MQTEKEGTGTVRSGPERASKCLKTHSSCLPDGPLCFQSLDFFHNTILSSLSNTSEAILSFHPAITALDHKRTNVTRSSLEGIRLFAWKCLSHTPKHTTTTAGSARASILCFWHRFNCLVQVGSHTLTSTSTHPELSYRCWFYTGLFVLEIEPERQKFMLELS